MAEPPEKKNKTAQAPREGDETHTHTDAEVSDGGGSEGKTRGTTIDRNLRIFEYDGEQCCLSRDAIYLKSVPRGPHPNVVGLCAGATVPEGTNILNARELKTNPSLREAAGVEYEEIADTGETIELICIGRNEDDCGQVVAKVEVDVAAIQVCFGGCGVDPVSVLHDNQNRVDPTVAIWIDPEQFQEKSAQLLASTEDGKAK